MERRLRAALFILVVFLGIILAASAWIGFGQNIIAGAAAAIVFLSSIALMGLSLRILVRPVNWILVISTISAFIIMMTLLLH